jgi:sulfonate transport system substrate-binding protein
MKKSLLALLVLTLCTALFAVPALAADYPAKMGITYVKSPLNVPSIVEKGLKTFETAFPKAKLSFPELTEGPKQTAALAAGEIAFASCLGSTSAILAASEGLDLKVIGIYSRAPKAFMVIVKDKALTDVRSLKGKKVGGPKGTILHQLLAAALAKNNMTIKDVRFISMDIPSAMSALANGSIDAALLAGPAAFNALSSGARTLVNGEGLIDATIVIATSADFMKKYPEAVKKYMKAHRNALEWIKKNPELAKIMTEKETGLKREGVETMYPWYDFNPTIKASDIKELEKTQEFMLANGLQRKKIDINKIIAK